METPAEREVDSPWLGNIPLDLSENERARIGLQFGELRKRKNLSQNTAAQQIGISRSHLSNIESGRSPPGWGRLMSMAAFYNVEIDTLVREVGEQGDQPLPVPERRHQERRQRPHPVENNHRRYMVPGVLVGATLSPWEIYVIEGLAKLPPSERRRLMEDLSAGVNTALKR